MHESRMRTTYILTLSFVASAAGAQVPEREFTTRRDSLAARVDSGVVIASLP